MANVTVVGETIVDRFIRVDGTVTDVAGGSAANTALALRSAGHQTYFRARFSSDDSGEFLRKTSIARGLDVSDSIITDHPATTVLVELDSRGVPTYTFSLEGTADWQWTRGEIAKPLPPDTDAIVLGSLASVLSPGCDVLLDWAKEKRAMGIMLCYDPNARPTVLENQDATRVRKIINQWVISSDVVKVSDEDLEWICPTMNPYEAACDWSTLGPELVVLTGADQGNWAFRHGQLVCHMSAPAIEVADTVGAGDTLMAWLVGGLLEHETEARFDSDHIAEILAVATKAAAITCTRIGCQPPSWSDVRNLLD